jgi:alkyl hydroperoxide reductase subunit AhpC
MICMIELGELEAQHEAFAGRQARVVVASLEGLEEAQKTKKDFPHLVVVADPERNLISAADVLHPGAGPHGADAAAPTTFLVDKKGVVRGVFRSRQIVGRLSPNELLAEVDRELPRPE